MASGNAPNISVIIPVRNDPDNLKLCLQAITESVYREFECIVIDDASDDNRTRAVIGKFPVRSILQPVRKGPGFCRNLGARAAKGEVLFFVDADVQIYPDTIAKVVARFRENNLGVLVGSYDKEPGATNFIAQYKNLFHHYVHQNLADNIDTFWTGCGAIRRDIFFAVKGFSAIRTIEDIELGMRLSASGFAIHLDQDIQVKHLKRWTFVNMLKSDIRDRAIPWTRLLLTRRSLPNSLNLQASQRASVVLAFLALLAGGALLTTQAFQGTVAAIGLGAFLSLVIINKGFYCFFRRERGWRFALGVLPLHFLYFLYCGLSFVLGAGWVLFEKVTVSGGNCPSTDSVGTLHHEHA